MALTSLLLFFKMFISATRLSCVRSAVGQPQALSLVRPQGWSRPVAGGQPGRASPVRARVAGAQRPP